jgi:Protein of unknown function (DUF2914)/Tetratricopeptide repeat
MILRERMLATNDLRAILDAAEQAVAREDITSAERLLREALALQESTPGSQRDEVAKTLNNLAVVCEMTGKLGDAEKCYRRAYRIATASLPASDPFVTTSRENLEEFCKAQGLQVELPPVVAAAPRPPAVSKPVPAPAPPPQPAPPRAASPAPPLPASPAPPRAASPTLSLPASPAPPRAASPTPSLPASPAPPRAASPTPPRATPPTPPRAAAQAPPARVSLPIPSSGGRSRGILIAVLIFIAVVIAIVIARDWLATGAAPDRTTSVSQPESAAPAQPPTPVPAPPEPTPEPEPKPVAATPSPVAPAPEPVAPTPEPPPATIPSSGLTVVTAQVCRSLSTTGAWRCTPPSGAQGPGPMIFYTRVASPRDTTIEHRWYRNDQLHQRVQLRIRANASGFRTYSRTTVTSERAGNWKVELRAADGRVLDEETFSVR